MGTSEEAILAQGENYEHLQVTRAGEVVTVTLNRPAVHNALHAEMIDEIDRCFRAIGSDREVRVAILTGAGRSFCAGADVNWMRAAADYSEEENRADALNLVRMLEAVDTCPKPVIARVNGAALGGGAGLVAACDLAIAVETARFSFSEVRLGIAPATISPFVIRRIGPGAARAYFLLGEQFDAAEARRIGLVFRTAPPDALDTEVDRIIQSLLVGGPAAQAAIKELIRTVNAGAVPPKELAECTASLIAALRVSPEGQEGLRAFLDRRPPTWVPKREGQA